MKKQDLELLHEILNMMYEAQKTMPTETGFSLDTCSNKNHFTVTHWLQYTRDSKVFTSLIWNAHGFFENPDSIKRIKDYILSFSADKPVVEEDDF